MDAVHGKPGTHRGEISDPDGVGEHGSITCGDSMRFTFRVRRHPTDPLEDVITDARYLTFGCTSAIAASEALCTLIERDGFTPLQALKVTNQDIDHILAVFPGIVANLRRLSPYWDQQRNAPRADAEELVRANPRA